MSEVSFRGIEKRFDAQSLALRSLDLDVPDGAFLVLLGPSGCGKTTALRVLAGLELPTAGTVHIGDRDVTRIQPRDRDVAMVFQHFGLFPWKRLDENIAYGLELRGGSKAEIAATVAREAGRARRRQSYRRIAAWPPASASPAPPCRRP
jgi:multiple sugar transport system ATP-binding protein